MVRFFFLAAGLSCLGACSGPGKGSAQSAWSASRQASPSFRFDWQLSGDPAVAPMQVFDDGKETWLQFAPGQMLPAIFGVGSDGERALPYVRRDPYVVLAGGWNGLLFRGGRLTARAQRLQAVAEAAGAQEVDARSKPERTIGAGSASGSEADAGSKAARAIGAESSSGSAIDAGSKSDSAILAASRSGAAPGTVLRRTADAEVATSSSGSGASAGMAASPAAPPQSASQPVYRAAPPDATLRAVLARWAGLAGWTFQPQHWAVDVDIPLSATAEFRGDFKAAVRELLGATELAEKPLQPCFYGNRVLRVVPLAQSCMRAAPSGGTAA